MGRVLVLGNAGLDISLNVGRLPERGETLLGESVGRAPGGKGLNQAVAAARGGATVLFQAAIGTDAQGDEVAAALLIEQSLTFDPHRLAYPTDFSLLMVLPDGENSVVSAGSCAAAFSPEAAVNFAGKADHGDVLVLQGNLTADATRAALVAASRRGAIRVLNAAPLWWDVKPLLPLCDVIVVNRGEAEAITGVRDPVAAAADLRALGASVAVITLGADGCVVHDGARLDICRASPVEALDTTGCGDTFCGVFAAMLAEGRPVDVAVAVAQRAAAVTATRVGAFAAIPSRAELSAIVMPRRGH
jgi:ribokinase